MITTKNRAVALSVATLLFAALAPASNTSARHTVTMQFGRPDVGSGCNFPCEDDHSFHAVDAIAPGAVAISVGGTVAFDVEGFHQVAIYEAGTRPRDVAPDPAAFPFVNDPEGRIAIAAPLADFEFTFEKPGRYLVICNVAPHFVGAQMWAWVHVR